MYYTKKLRIFIGKLIQFQITNVRPDIFTYGCNAHYLNLIEDAVSPNSVMKHIVQIHKFFRNTHRPHAWLKVKRNYKMPQLPNDTRWNSQVDCIDTFVSNYNLYREIIDEHDEFKTDQKYITIAAKLSNVQVLNHAIDLQQQLRIVGVALDRLQRDDTKLQDAVEIWKDVLKNPKLEPYNEKINHYFKQAITPFHYLAYLLDPKKTKIGVLNNDEEAKAEE